MQQQSVEINSVKWVLKELQPMLKDVQRALETCAEQGDGYGALQGSVHVLGQARGTLQMVELYGAAQLADEMQHAATALIEGRADDAERALETLLRTALQLPDYLERLQAGSRDVPLVLLPLLNDLREARGAEPLTDRELFFPDLSAPPAVEVSPIGSLKVIARAQRRRFQRYLLAWLKGQTTANLQGIDQVFGGLEQASAEIASRRVWYIARALTESCLEGGLDAAVLKPFMGQIDRLVRTLVNEGERKFQAEISLDFLKGMLYQVARTSSAGQRVTEVRATYQLAKLLPSQEQIALAKQTLAGPNLELLAVVNSSIKEDISQIKDAIEIYVHSEDKNREKLRPLQELFGRVSDTVHMLGIDKAQILLKDHAKEVTSILESESEVSAERLMSLAGVLLSVEETLDDFVAERADLMGNLPVSPGREDTLAIAALPGPEFQALLSAVIREALGDLARAREGILAYLSNPDREDHLHSVPGLLNEVNGAMFMLPLDKVVPLLQGLVDYVRMAVIAARRYPSERDQNLLADVVAAIEYYLEAVEQGRGDMTHILARGERALAALRSPDGGGGATSELQPTQLNVVRKRAAVIPDKVSAPPPATSAETLVEAPVEVQPLEQPSPAPAAQAKARSHGESPPIPVIGEDVDEEILEVFLEEAVGELQEISQHLPQWQADTGNETSLVRIRRAFHTLKGSGRVIGAELIGQFAWSIENLLNQVIAGRVVKLTPVFELLEEAIGVLPQLIEQLRGNPEPIKNIMDLVARGHALADPPSEPLAAELPEESAVADTPAPQSTPEEQYPPPPESITAESVHEVREQAPPSVDVEDVAEAQDAESVTMESDAEHKEVLDNFEVEEVGEAQDAESVTMESDAEHKEVLDNFEVEEVGEAQDAESVTMESDAEHKEVLDNFEVEE
ncbi:MAG: Hpt domain-containing protein, partial [Gammaproteobacteria bacterium]|nr:Hpt domain-containing protein [Gammaproteobacteria bacterium]